MTKAIIKHLRHAADRIEAWSDKGGMKIIDGHQCVPAFTVGGRTWYRIAEKEKVPYGRYLAVTLFYEELNMRMTREFVQANMAAIKTEMDKPKPAFSKAVKLVDCVLDRLEWVYEPDVAWKLGTAVFFEKDELLYSWSADRAQKTIAFWKKHLDESFFLSEPWKTFIPPPDYLQRDTQACMNLFAKIREQNENWLELIQGADLSSYMRPDDLARFNLLLATGSHTSTI